MLGKCSVWPLSFKILELPRGLRSRPGLSGPPQLPAPSPQGCACEDPQGQRATSLPGLPGGGAAPAAREEAPGSDPRGVDAVRVPPWPAGSGCPRTRAWPGANGRARMCASAACRAALVGPEAAPGAVRHGRRMGGVRRELRRHSTPKVEGPHGAGGEPLEPRSASGPSRHRLTGEEAQTCLPSRGS